MGWVIAAAVLVLGWVAGWRVWHDERSPALYGAIPFDWFETIALGGLASLGYGTAALLFRGNGRRRTRIAWAALAGTTLVVGYLLSFTWFAGLCFDPGPYCRTTWPSRLLPLAAAVGVCAIAAVACEIRRGTGSDKAV